MGFSKKNHRPTRLSIEQKMVLWIKVYFLMENIFNVNNPKHIIAFSPTTNTINGTHTILQKNVLFVGNYCWYNIIINVLLCSICYINVLTKSNMYFVIQQANIVVFIPHNVCNKYFQSQYCSCNCMISMRSITFSNLHNFSTQKNGIFSGLKVHWT